MTYILQALFNSELEARKEYLLHTYHRYFVEVKRTSSYIELKSFPFTDDNIVMLYGHCPWIIRYFEKNGAQFRRKIKIINSCYPDIFVWVTNQKYVYYSKVNLAKEACCYTGKNYGISFDVTDSELDALNSAHLPLMEQIEFAYERVA